jgi:hypothetical protein
MQNVTVFLVFCEYLKLIIYNFHSQAAPGNPAGRGLHIS